MSMPMENLMNQIEALKVEMEKFDRGNKSAGTRARKVCQDIKKACQDIRNYIQEKKKGD